LQATTKKHVVYLFGAKDSVQKAEEYFVKFMKGDAESSEAPVRPRNTNAPRKPKNNINTFDKWLDHIDDLWGPQDVEPKS
jgi:hypothetical protein